MALGDSALCQSDLQLFKVDCYWFKSTNLHYFYLSCSFLAFLTAIIKMHLTFFNAGQVFNYGYLTETKNCNTKKTYNIFLSGTGKTVMCPTVLLTWTVKSNVLSRPKYTFFLISCGYSWYNLFHTDNEKIKANIWRRKLFKWFSYTLQVWGVFIT